MATYAPPLQPRRVETRRAESVAQDNLRALVPIGRVLFSAIFIVSGLGHFTIGMIDFAAQQGVPMANVLVPLSGLLAVVGGLSILLGFHARFGAWLVVLFLVVVTPAIHHFWTFSDPAARAVQMGMFMKNVAMLGGALLIVFFGAGPLSLDRARRGHWPSTA
ncbi:MAG TPA: DoxX family protein [Gemmatimonadales bacterium]|nr:DoxX family protein [Gemmatimonadales bacterium]